MVSHSLVPHVKYRMYWAFGSLRCAVHTWTPRSSGDLQFERLTMVTSANLSPKLSIGLPVYNKERSLRQAFDYLPACETVPVVSEVELAVVVPTFNERDNIRPLLDRLEVALGGLSWEAIFVDDDSRLRGRSLMTLRADD